MYNGMSSSRDACHVTRSSQEWLGRGKEGMIQACAMDLHEANLKTLLLALISALLSMQHAGNVLTWPCRLWLCWENSTTGLQDMRRITKQLTGSGSVVLIEIDPQLQMNVCHYV